MGNCSSSPFQTQYKRVYNPLAVLQPVTSDEALYEIATMKENITTQVLKAVKEASIDCALHTKKGDKENHRSIRF